MTFATVGVGSIPQLLGVLLQLHADLKLIEVPYKGMSNQLFTLT
jgi:hypothetical protein